MGGVIFFLVIMAVVFRLISSQEEEEAKKQHDEDYAQVMGALNLINLANEAAIKHSREVEPNMVHARNSVLYHGVKKYQYVTAKTYRDNGEVNSYDTQVWAITENEEGWLPVYNSSIRFGGSGKTKKESVDFAKELMDRNLKGALNTKAKRVFDLKPNTDTMFIEGVKFDIV